MKRIWFPPSAWNLLVCLWNVVPLSHRRICLNSSWLSPCAPAQVRVHLRAEQLCPQPHDACIKASIHPSEFLLHCRLIVKSSCFARDNLKFVLRKNPALSEIRISSLQASPSFGHRQTCPLFCEKKHLLPMASISWSVSALPTTASGDVTCGKRGLRIQLSLEPNNGLFLCSCLWPEVVREPVKPFTKAWGLSFVASWG